MSTPRDTTIYIPLLDEGTDCWRPASAEHVRGDIYRIRGEIPPEEVWQFKPGEMVRARYEKKSSGDTVLVAYEIAAI